MSQQITTYVSEILDSKQVSHMQGQTIGPICNESLPLLVGAILQMFEARRGATTVWIEIPNIRQRELLVSTIQGFGPDVLSWPIETKFMGDAMALRSGVLSQINLEKSVGILVPEGWTEMSCMTPQSLMEEARAFKVGSEVDLEKLKTELISEGYERVSTVIEPGQFAIRGGIVDIFSLSEQRPVRVELFDVEIDSIREFDLHTQISVKDLEVWETHWNTNEEKGSLLDYTKEGDILITVDNPSSAPSIKGVSRWILSTAPIGYDCECEIQGSPFPSMNPGDFVMQEASHRLIKSQLESWVHQGWVVYLASGLEGERERFFEILGGEWKSHPSVVLIHESFMHTLVIPQKQVVLVSLSEIFGRYQVVERTTAQADFWQTAASRHAKTEELKPGELVVHAEYGIGRLLDVFEQRVGEEESIQIEYDNGAILEVPIAQSHLVAKYVGVGVQSPNLSKLGDAKWSRLKEKAKGAVIDYAARMLRVQAERAAEQGTPHPPDTKWMWEFESSFPYQETPDQLKAIEETKKDMESPYAMDRLVCGDVGFGKTEIAIRAAFKAVCGGFQVVMLAPTTVLAEQHYRTFCKRMSEYPLRIDLLNRFRKSSEIRSTLKGLNDGSVDIVIGTHKVLSEKVSYSNLGLVVIDEEQRFGVKHKEKFKERFAQIDMLTLSATPIPRTLYLSLMGARDMSVLNTPPANRNPVQTQVLSYDERIIQRAIEREMSRGGQVYLLHNRVRTIHKLAHRVQELVPYARIVVGHGQMDREDLESVMHDFVGGQADVLLATTIIESGIDIPNANTIVIDRADLFGLSDLYQLRGRVGRADRQAYAYLLLPSKDLYTGDAKKRVSAIKQFTALGSGFKIAMRDLEIRGAGNLLGTKQSGHIAAVGFDLYCQLLKESIAKLKGSSTGLKADTTIRVDFIVFAESRYVSGKGICPAFIPTQFITDGQERLAAHRKLSLSDGIATLQDIQREWRDRYGILPLAAKNLIVVTRIKLYAAMAKVDSIEVKDGRVMIARNGGYITLAKGAFPRLVKNKPNAKLLEFEALMKDLAINS